MHARLATGPAALCAACLLPACPGGATIDDDSALADDDTVADDDDTGPGDDDDDDATPTQSEPVEIATEDGLVISGTFQAAPGVASGPAVLMLHQIFNDRHDFDDQWFNFQEAGISTLAIDFRSHGGSDAAPVTQAELLTDPNQLRFDVEAALDYLRSRPEFVDPLRIGIIGVSVGANMAVVANHNSQTGDWGVKSICAISPDLENSQALAGTTELVLAGAQYVAAELNAEDTADAQALFDITGEPRDLRSVLDTSAHGADLLAASPSAREGTVAWFVEELEAD
jgi:dienelactone hydrolase